MTEHLGFTHTVTLGALVSAVVALGVLALVHVVTGKRIGLFEVLEALVVGGAVALLQFLLVSDGFGRLHVAYLYVFVTLPILGGAVLAAALVPSLRPTRWGLVAGGGLLALGAVGFYATHIEPFRLRVDRATLDVAPVDGEPLRVAVLADLQTGDVTSYERDAIDRLTAEEPDLILVAGDLLQTDGPDFDRHADEMRELLAQLDAPGGVYVTEGDVDSPGRMTYLTEGLDNLTWLDDEVVTTEVRGQTVHVGGISVRYREPSAQAAIDDLAARDDGELRLLVSHRPDAAYHVPEDGLDLLVAGHTHGGQVALPFIGPPITLSNVPREVAAGGLHEVDGIPIYLTTGVGMERVTAPQVRFGVRPSFGIVTLE